MSLKEIAETFESGRMSAIPTYARHGAFFMPIRDGDYKDVVTTLRRAHKDKCQTGILLGIGGGINLSIMAALHMQGALLVAPDDDQYALWNHILPIIGSSPTKEECVTKIKGFIESHCYDGDEQPRDGKSVKLNVKYYELKALLGDGYSFPSYLYEESGDFSFGHNPDERFKKAYTPQHFDFLKNDALYAHVRQAVKNGNVGVVRLNVMDRNEVQRLVDLLRKEHRVTVARLSNILMHYKIGQRGYLGDAAHSTEDKLKSLDLIFPDGPLIIEHSTKNAITQKPEPMLYPTFSDCARYTNERLRGTISI